MKIRLAATLVLSLAAIPLLAQQQDFSKVEVKAQKLTEGLYMLTGSGGNIGLSVGKDGAYVVDDQYAPLSERILATIRTITPAPIRFVVNTHWHGDHTGGNENLGKTGALLVAHENVRRRMSTEQFMAAFGRKIEPSPVAALPILTFTDAVTFHWNDDEIRVQHVAPAHTDGDSIIRFVKADVVHMGDLLTNGSYPFIDTSSGGRIDGYLAAADQVLGGAGEKTRIIPGHGPLAAKADLQAFRDMVKTVRDRVAKLKAEGRTRDQAIAAKPTADYDAKWGGGFIKGDSFAGLAYDSLP